MSETAGTGKRPRGRPRVQEGGRGAGLNMTMSPRTKAALESYAKDEGRSLSQAAERLIEEALEGRAQLISRLGGSAVASTILTMIETARQAEAQYGDPTQSILARDVLVHAWIKDAERLFARMGTDEFDFLTHEVEVIDGVQTLLGIAKEIGRPLALQMKAPWEQFFDLADVICDQLGAKSPRRLDRSAEDETIKLGFAEICGAWFSEGVAADVADALSTAAMKARALSAKVRTERLRRKVEAQTFERMRTYAIPFEDNDLGSN